MNMKRSAIHFLSVLLLLSSQAVTAMGQVAQVKSPDGRLQVDIDVNDGSPVYSVKYDNHDMLLQSPLGLVTNIGDLTKDMRLVRTDERSIDEHYDMDRSKVAHVHYVANELIVHLRGSQRQLLDIVFRVSNNDIAFCILRKKTHLRDSAICAAPSPTASRIISAHKNECLRVAEQFCLFKIDCRFCVRDIEKR